VQTLLAALLALGLVGCGPECRDEDGDGRGAGCERGGDCDDADPGRAIHCIEVPKRCVDEPMLAGCPCRAESDDSCYAADPATLDVGVCRAGRAGCSSGVILECQGAVLPSGEDCNGLDDDCDGVVDEWVLSPCGGCNAECIGELWGPPAQAFEASGGTALTTAGELTLEQASREALRVWVPNTDDGTLSLIDARDARELARYATPGRRPIRVGVDQRGDAWVLDAEGSSGEAARLSKYAGDRERCRDRDGNGVDTSSGPGDVRANDECRLLDVAAGEVGDDAQALAIDGTLAPDRDLAGNPWVGFAASGRVRAYDGQTGAPLMAAELPAFSSHAARFDVWGTLWLIDRDGLLASVDPSSAPPGVRIRSAPLACFTLEDLAVDRSDRLLFTGFGCESLVSFDVRTEHWQTVRVPELLSPRGIAANGGGHWVSYTSGQVSSIATSPLAVEGIEDLSGEGASPLESRAIAADSLGQLWIVSTQGGPEGRGLVTRYDPVARKVTAQIPVGRGPRGAGDLTGMALGSSFVREAAASHVFEAGCSGNGQDDEDKSAGTRWKAIHLGALVGAGGEIELAVRWAKDALSLEAATYRRLGTFPADGPTFPLELPDAGAVEVQLTLRTAYATGAPRVSRVGLEWSCSGPD
jgi:streptogramin lyase